MRGKTMTYKPLLIGLAILALGSGCATQVTINSNPPGAMVYARGSGRAAYRWEMKGAAPVTYKSWYSVEKSFVTWPDGTRSDVVRTPFGWNKAVTVDFAHPDKARRAQARQ